MTCLAMPVFVRTSTRTPGLWLSMSKAWAIDYVVAMKPQASAALGAPFVFSAGATNDARCFSLGFHATAKGIGQMRVTEGTLPLGVKPVNMLYDTTGECAAGSRRICNN